MDMDGRVALVTGAGSGIGEATAIRLAAAGARVGLLGRTADELEEVEARIRADGGEATTLLADITDASAMDRCAASLAEAYGRIDAVIANAGVNGVWAPVDDLTAEEFDRTVAINLGGTFRTIRSTVPHLKRAGGGSIVVTSSINGTRTFTTAGATAYAATKAAQVAMVQMLAVELGRHRIRVNAVCPGLIETEIMENTRQRRTGEAEVPAEFPEGDIPLTGGAGGKPEDVADLVHFLVSDRARHITGTPVWIDGGQSLLR